MLLLPFASPRRLMIFGIFVFFAILVLVRNSQYSAYIPKYDIPLPKTGSSSGSSSGSGSGSGSIEKPQDSAAVPPPPMWQDYKPGQEQDKDTSHKTGPPADDPEEFPVEQPAKIAPPPPPPTEILSTVTSTHSPIPSTGSAASASAATTTTTTEKVQPLVHLSYAEVQKKVEQFVHQWTPPDTPGHWPPWDGYKDKDYDPNRWEGLPWYVTCWPSKKYVSNGIQPG